MPVDDFVLYAGTALPGKKSGGKKKEYTEDFLVIRPVDDDLLFAAIADGAGTEGGVEGARFEPASLACNKTYEMVRRLYLKDKAFFLSRPRYFLEEAVITAGNILAAFKIAGGDGYFSYGASLSCCLIGRDGRLAMAHAGNTRIHLLRKSAKAKDGHRLLQLTKDHTLAQEHVDSGILPAEDYYTSDERFTLTNALGVSGNLAVQTFDFTLRRDDIVIMTTDGVHYNIRPEGFWAILAKERPDTADEYAAKIIEYSAQAEAYLDDIAVNILWFIGGR